MCRVSKALRLHTYKYYYDLELTTLITAKVDPQSEMLALFSVTFLQNSYWGRKNYTFP